MLMKNMHRGCNNVLVSVSVIIEPGEDVEIQTGRWQPPINAVKFEWFLKFESKLMTDVDV